MPVTKRSSKIVSYNEHDDDDDFIPIVDNSKKNRRTKSNEPVKAVGKHEEKCVNLAPPPPSEQEEPKKPPELVIIENDLQESASSQSSASSDGMNELLSRGDSKTSNADDQASPKNKRLKHDEDHTNENEDEPTLIIHSDQPASRDCSNLPKRNSSIPLGFPTSKINIPSPHISRVGLSRKSLPVKPLHPNFTSRVVHE